jgi:hypothetical protein
MDNNWKILKVTVEEFYLVPMLDEERTKINGWTMDQVKEDWFVTHNINSPHATRNSHQIGYSGKVVDIEELDEIPEG